MMLKIGTRIRFKTLIELIEESGVTNSNTIEIAGIILSLDKGHSKYCNRTGTIIEIKRDYSQAIIYTVKMDDENLQELKIPLGFFEVI